MALETIVGNLKAYNQLRNGTFQHVDELQAERINNASMRSQWFYTADGNGYFLRDDEGVDWVITREAENLVLRHLYDAVDSSFEQLTQKNNYYPGNVEALVAKSAEGSIVVDLNQLRLSGDDDEWRYLSIRTSDGFIGTNKGYQAPNPEEQKAMNRLGCTKQTLDMLKNAKITKTKIYVLSLEYVQNEIKDASEHCSVWRASWLYNFCNDSDFGALNRNIYNRLRLRGVRASEASTEAPEGRGIVPTTILPVPQNISYHQCYQILLSNPSEAAKALDDATAAGLLEIIQTYRLPAKTQ